MREEASSGPIVVLSPHPDDAVLSAWHVLDSPADVRVITVFAGVPEPGFVTTLDRQRGGIESAGIVRRRQADDRAALAVAGREPLHGDLLDADYRAYRLPELRAAIAHDPGRFIPLVAAEPRVDVPPAELVASLGDWLDGEVVYAPAGIGRHPDHRAVARLGVHLLHQGLHVRLYADTPYVLRHGPPSFLGGRANEQADAAVAEAFAALGEPPEAFERRIVELRPEQVAAKLLAFTRYATEYALVDADFDGAPSDPERMRREVEWDGRGADAGR